MSWMAAGWVKHCRLGGASRKAVMLVIADYATENGDAVGVDVPEGSAVCWAGIAEIAANAEVGASTVRRILADLEGAGVIRRMHRGRRWGIGGRSTDLIYIEYARPFMDITSYRSDRALTPVDASVDDSVDNSDEDNSDNQGYRSPDRGLALDPEGVSAHLVSAQNLQKNHHLTDNNLPAGNATHDRARPSGELRSSLVSAAPPALARPPPTS
jgi:ribosomal protein S25